MAVAVLPRASAAIHAAVYAARHGALGKRACDSSMKTTTEGKNGNFVCSPFSILLVLAVAMRGARGRTLEEMQRLLPSSALPSLLRLTTYSSKESRHGRGVSGGSPGEPGSDEDTWRVTDTELDIVSRMYVDGRLETKAAFRSFERVLQQECSSGHAGRQQLPVGLIDCDKACETAKEINAFVSEATRGHITDLVSPDLITERTRLLLVSAAFFKGSWQTPFQENETEKGFFHALQSPAVECVTTHGASVSEENSGEKSESVSRDLPLHAETDLREPRLVVQMVNIMHVVLDTPAHFFVSIDDVVTGVGLPYSNSRYVMYVVQPNDPRNLARLMRAESETQNEGGFPTFDSVVRSMRGSHHKWQGAEVHLSLPKFTLKAADNYLDLIPLFARWLQITAPFDRRLADFSRISGDRTLLMSAFVHEADIQVDEKGTVATAATMAAIAVMSAYFEKQVVKVSINKPFAFQIRYHGSETLVAQEEQASRLDYTGESDTPELGDYVLYSGCVVDALAAQK